MSKYCLCSRAGVSGTSEPIFKVTKKGKKVFKRQSSCNTCIIQSNSYLLLYTTHGAGVFTFKVWSMHVIHNTLYAVHDTNKFGSH